MVCASPSYLERAGRPERPEALADHACLTFRSHPGSNLWRFRKGQSSVSVRATGPFFADDGETLIAAAAAGLGIVLVPEWLLGPEAAADRLVDILTDWTPDPARSPLYAVYAPGPYVAPKIRAVIDFLAERFAGDYPWRG